MAHALARPYVRSVTLPEKEPSMRSRMTGSSLAVGLAALSLGVFAVPAIASPGALDPTFNGGGTARANVGAPDTDEAAAVAIQSDGSLVVAGDADINQGQDDIGLLRYDAFGSLDAGFGVGGKVATDLGAWQMARDVAIQTDGKIVVAGTSVADFLLARYNADGSPDTSFG